MSSATDRQRRDQELSGLAALDYNEPITQFARGSISRLVGNSATVIDFRPLYAISKRHFHRQLAGGISSIVKMEKNDEQLTTNDFKFIHSNRWNTEFVKDITASRLDNGPGLKLQGILMSEFGLAQKHQAHAMYTDSDLLGDFNTKLVQHCPTISATRARDRQRERERQQRRRAVVDTWHRFKFAIISGIAIVGPVMILVVDTEEPKTPAVVSVSTLLFALCIAPFSRSVPDNMLAATAAYAAVLSVVIGNNSSSRSCK
ncbi:hypothetical protein BJ878DRAFT_483726 [Calycina marina]|uniref:DUF6594 domain-containing protein n=1 Tax=Calycina marina TaxID=1763456 RepID=A0A9P7YVL8_9HELO|nr:hypothetical protein BJ878DRAFT_483726 [Calycina marina]